MKKSEMKILLQKNWLFYLLTILIALAMRSLCRITDSDALTWILTPTARWAGILGGIPFEYLPHMGYVNHFYRFLIAPSCAGIRFMMITFLMLTFSFIHRFQSYRAKALYLTGGAVFSYLFTIFVNGIRIVTAIYLPIPLEQAGLLNGWLNPDRLHTLIGTVVYFSALCVIYPAVSTIPKSESRLLAPAFWYLLAVVAVPSAGRLLRNDWEGFDSYVLLIVGTCLVILAVTCLIRRILRFHA